MKKVSKSTLIRTGVLALAIANNGLALVNKSPLPISNEDVTAVVSFGFTTVTSVVAWWKNNSFTQEALVADEILRQQKEDK